MLIVDSTSSEIIIDRGDDQTVRFTVKDSTGAVVNVTGGAFLFTVKEEIDDLQALAKFTRADPVANGIDVAQAATGILDVSIIPANTSALAGRYFYDLQMTLATKVRTLARGVFIVRKDVST